MCSLKDVPFFSKSKERYCCFVLAMTRRNTEGRTIAGTGKTYDHHADTEKAGAAAASKPAVSKPVVKKVVVTPQAQD